jgi:hypothetical protein
MKRFQRPDKVDITSTNRNVSVVGAPIDFAKAQVVQGEVIP